MDEDYGTIWVCTCCMITHANGGPCCEDNERAHTPARDERGRFTGGTVLGDSYPWAKVDFRRFDVAMGLTAEEHQCMDDSGIRPDECDCERDTFSRAQCDGCGTYLHGERHAFRLWKGTRR